ncbi:DUF4328 domain-containing protein [Nocardia otitidiscaviarum]|uniref:DUF4328 domain-containing protein n=1 Tax=Nocardia otitidiscaviarum TaxID=1823 RepID=UPI00189458AC|nr:DUF4328 domain-containing protein [Nocardia otitidiscaviarum]MBF6178820.1 DUF4328 domain-containing protein [Nocardia otitidiscaviarum]
MSSVPRSPTRSPVVQPCARCGARWAVQGTPLHWCPRCHGVLLSPAPVDAPPARRNYRWVARPPGRRKSPAPGPRRSGSWETPHYTRIPRWGLRDVPPQPAVAPAGRWDRLAARVPLLLTVTAGVFLAAGLAELGRYGILLRNRTRLTEPWLLALSDALVYTTALAALLLALVSAVAVVGRLADLRRAAYAEAGQRDPRSSLMLALGCLVPVANLLWPGVFLTEVARRRADPRLLRAVRIWWGVWIGNALMVFGALLWRLPDSLQAEADGVLWTAVTDLVAAGVAVLTLWVLRGCEGLDVLGRPRAGHRWTVATAPAEPVIEPVRPGGSAERAPRAAVGNDEATVSAPAGEPQNPDGSPEFEHEEVLAK